MSPHAKGGTSSQRASLTANAPMSPAETPTRTASRLLRADGPKTTGARKIHATPNGQMMRARSYSELGGGRRNREILAYCVKLASNLGARPTRSEGANTW
jgi:hypothetical protein